MCKFDCFCVGSFMPERPNKTCLDCTLRKANQDLKPKKAMTARFYEPRRLKIRGVIPRHIAKVLKEESEKEARFEALKLNKIAQR